MIGYITKCYIFGQSRKMRKRKYSTRLLTFSTVPQDGCLLERLRLVGLQFHKPAGADLAGTALLVRHIAPGRLFLLFVLEMFAVIKSTTTKFSNNMRHTRVVRRSPLWTSLVWRGCCGGEFAPRQQMRCTLRILEAARKTNSHHQLAQQVPQYIHYLL